MSAEAEYADEQVGWGAVRRADPDAFRRLFDGHNKAVYNFCFRATGSWSTAEEATQACFATVWRRAREGSLPELPEGVRGWLLAVARNECANLTRSATRHLRLVGKIGSQPSTDPDNVAAWTDSEAAMGQILKVLSRVPDAQREVIELVAWSGLSMIEAAAALRVPVGTVKSRLSRARQTLATSEVAHLLGQES